MMQYNINSKIDCDADRGGMTLSESGHIQSSKRLAMSKQIARQIQDVFTQPQPFFDIQLAISAGRSWRIHRVALTYKT